MKILFLTLVHIESIEERNLYADLMRQFRKEGHDVYIVTPVERRLNQPTTLAESAGVKILKIKTLNIQKTNLLEKGLATLTIEFQFLVGVKKYFPKIHFDLVLYSTPPITFTKIIQYIKTRDKAASYLLLKDIFPQNAVDLGLIKKNGLIHSYFSKKEKQLYLISDYIGCMSPANVDYLISHNTFLDHSRIEVNPNSIEPNTNLIVNSDKLIIRAKYGIPNEITTFIYGGNLGKPQGTDFLLEILNTHKEDQDMFFVIVGSGTDFNKINTWFAKIKPKNAILLPLLKKYDFDQLIQSCDIGLIFLDRRFTIPNFPSRLLSYLEYKLPVLACTDKNTDLGRIIEENDFGLWAESGDIYTMSKHLQQFVATASLVKEMGRNGFDFLQKNYTVSNSYTTIIKHFTGRIERNKND